MAKKWLDLLDQELGQHNTAAVSREVLEEGGQPASGAISKNGRAPEKGTDKIDKNDKTLAKQVKKTKKKKLTPEEEAEERSQLAERWPGYVITDDRARECLEWAKNTFQVAIDTETYGRVKRDGLLYTRGEIRLIILHEDGVTWMVDCRYVSKGLVAQILDALRPSSKIFHNAMFDVPRLYKHFGILLDEDVDDTAIASRVARAGEWERRKGALVQKEHKLEACLKRELGVDITKDKELRWGDHLTEEHLIYASDDVAHMHDLLYALEEVQLELELRECYQAVISCLPTFIGAAVRGVPLEARSLQPILDTYEKERDDLCARLDELAPEHPEGGTWSWGNKNAPDAKDKHGNEIGRNGARRALGILGVELPNLQGQTLLDHREDHEIVGVLYNYYEKANTFSRYRKWIPDFYDHNTGRLYAQAKVAGAVTGRVLYGDPNAQGIDKHKTKEFRKVIRAPEGRSIVTGDFAQQELRIAAYYSEDRAMLEAFTNGEDIYLRTATKLVGEERAVEARPAAKRATLGFLYGLGVDKYRTNVYKDTGEPLSGEQAVKDRQAFRAAFPTFYNWQKRYGARKEWETRSVLGWRRVVSPSKDREGNTVPKYTERLNGPIQSTAGDLLYLTLEKIAQDPRSDTHFLLSVHDELVLESPEDDARNVALWLKEKMRSSIEDVLGKDLGGENSVEVSYGPSWGETTEEV